MYEQKVHLNLQFKPFNKTIIYYQAESSNYGFVNSRGVQLAGKIWAPDGFPSPLGLVYISHGYAEHMQYYSQVGFYRDQGMYESIQLGNALADAGLYVFGHDHEGHGRSGGERVNIADFQLFVDDVFEDINLQTKIFPG